MLRLWRKAKARKAARQYARCLPAQLHTDYGASATYSAAQIRRSADRAHLPAAFIGIGLAMFLDEHAFAALDLPPMLLSRGEVLEILAQVQQRTAGAVDPAPLNSDAFSGFSPPT